VQSGWLEVANFPLATIVFPFCFLARWIVFLRFFWGCIYSVNLKAKNNDELKFFAIWCSIGVREMGILMEPASDRTLLKQQGLYYRWYERSIPVQRSPLPTTNWQNFQSCEVNKNSYGRSTI
jgi:hypothetical protein